MLFVNSISSRLTMLVLVLSMALIGCASNPDTASTAVGVDETKSAETITASESDKSDKGDQPELPGTELTQELLEQLLVVSFAPYGGDLIKGAEQAFKAAESSKDYRLASFAAVTGLRIRKYELARKSAELWLELVPESAGAKTTLIVAHLGLGDAEEVYSLLKARDGDLGLDEQVEIAVQLLAGQRNAQTAIQVIEKYSVDNPDSADALLSAAFVNEHFKKYPEAEVWLDKALDLNPSWDRAAQLKATLLRRQGKDDERAEFIRRFLEKNPESVSMRINHAAELARQEKFEQALALMQEVIADDGQNIPALNYAAALAEHLENTDLAKSLYRRVLRIEPNNDEVNWTLARFAVVEKDYSRAEKYYRDISGEQLYYRAQLQVANMRYHTRGLKDAIAALRALEPRTEQEYVDRATTRHYLLMQEHQHEEAFAAINETLIYLPENLDLRYARSLVAAELKEVETVEVDLQFVISRQPDNADALNALGYTLADQTGRLEEARDLIAKALELRPDAAHILDSMGWVLYRLGDLDDAATYLEQAYEKAPQAEIAAHLGEVYWEQGKKEEARKIWSEAFIEDSKNPVLLATMERYGVPINDLKAEESISMLQSSNALN